MVVLIVAGVLIAPAVAGRLRERSRRDWFEGRHLTLAPVVKGLKEPAYVVGPPDGSKRLFILERDGRIKVADKDGNLRPAPLLDLTRETANVEEQGLLGLVFHPAFTQNGYVYIHYTATDYSVRVVRYTIAPERPNSIDPATAQTLLTIPKKTEFHNGGMLAFGPDGYLYIAVGDDDDEENAQNLGSLNGKILRIDVNAAQPYAIPPSNPFAQQPGARGEVWSYGLRNPWRFSFDRATGDMWISDVGDHTWETITFQPANSRGGENYGWPYFEGHQCMKPARCGEITPVPPLVTYGHDMNCAVIGGFVYRGPTVPAFTGKYLYGDLCTGGVFTVGDSPDRPRKRVELGYQPIKISSFGEDPAGDVYVVDFQDGVIYRIVEGSIPAAR
jgi:glucose/arabinose dehydrogenase